MRIEEHSIREATPDLPLSNFCADVKKETLRFLHAGKEITDGAPLTDQSLRHDSIVHLIRTKVHPLLKANKLPKPEQPSRPPGAFKKKWVLASAYFL